MQKLIKFRHGNHKGIFTYTVFENEFVTLSKIDTGKIEYIRKHGSIDLTKDMDSENYDMMQVDIIEDPAYVQKVYDYLIETGNAYFENGIEGLCVLKFYL
jgi:tRNA A58 N-methylase Trm61